jgi:hypothetical protein
VNKRIKCYTQFCPSRWGIHTPVDCPVSRSFQMLIVTHLYSLTCYQITYTVLTAPCRAACIACAPRLGSRACQAIPAPSRPWSTPARRTQNQLFRLELTTARHPPHMSMSISMFHVESALRGSLARVESIGSPPQESGAVWVMSCVVAPPSWNFHEAESPPPRSCPCTSS